jgi:hypothetical protein
MTSIDASYNIPDGWTVCDLKEDAWHKNERAHQKLRVKKDNNRPLCCVCFTRNCLGFDSVPVHGTRSLKKSKYVQHKMTKFYAQSCMNDTFVDWRAGESMEHVPAPAPTHNYDENTTPEALETPERLD